MDRTAHTPRFGVRALLLATLVAGPGCALEEGDVGAESELLQSAEEGGPGVNTAAITASYAAGTRVQTTANLNLRTGASTSDTILLVIPNGAIATLATDPGPTGGWYHLTYNGQTGYSYGAYLRVAPSDGGSTGGTTGGSTGGTSSGSTGGTSSGSTGGTSSGVEGGMERARAGVGFSYWWGHGRFVMTGPTASTRGTCSGSCPSCTHGGSYGADCSGYVGKIWAVPASNATVSTDAHPYSTWHFTNTTGSGAWAQIARGNLRRGDAMVYNTSGAGHIFLYESGDPWGSMWAYEARGCSYGIVHNLRTASSSYGAIRRTGW